MPILGEMRSNSRLAGICTILVLAAALLPDLAIEQAHAQKATALISASSSGEPANGWSERPSISADGRFIAYVSQADNLVPGDTNRAADIFLYDRADTSTRRISLTNGGEQADGWSFHPQISADGRFIAFTSVAQNLATGDTNGLADIFLHDLLTSKTQRISLGKAGEPANGWSDRASLSADGRFLVFVSTASNLVYGDTNGVMDVFLFDRLTGQTRRLSVTSEGAQANGPSGWDAVISTDGRTVVFVSKADNLSPGARSHVAELFIHQRATGEIKRLAPAGTNHKLDSQVWPSLSSGGELVAYRSVHTDPASGPRDTVTVADTKTGATREIFLALPGEQYHPVLSASGRFLWVAVRDPAEGRPRLIRRDLQTGAIEPMDVAFQDFVAAVHSSPPAVSGSGQVAAFGAVLLQETTATLAPAAVMALGWQPEDPVASFVAGQITDQTGLPLSNASVRSADGEETRTGPDGRFYLGGLLPGQTVLRFEKEGFVFSPPELVIDVDSDSSGLEVKAELERVLEEARLDIGMPYSFHRGCDSDLEACGGPYHGFFAGYCTDLVLDAYRGGLGLNIQFALERDALIHPDHFYRWRNARNSHDLWRYFHYTDQMLANDQPYLPGDILFFDWDDDEVIDHVSVLSETTARGSPKRMIDATGEIAYNPSGLAAELEWEAFHDQTVRGHARWRGSFGPSWNDVPENLEMLQIAADSASVSLRLVDENGRQLSTNHRPGGPNAAGSVLIGGSFHSQPLGEVLALQSPRAHGQSFILEITSRQARPFYLHFQTKFGPQVTQYEGAWQDPIEPGDRIRIGLVLHGQGENLRLLIIELQS